MHCCKWLHPGALYNPRTAPKGARCAQCYAAVWPANDPCSWFHASISRRLSREMDGRTRANAATKSFRDTGRSAAAGRSRIAGPIDRTGPRAASLAVAPSGRPRSVVRLWVSQCVYTRCDVRATQHGRTELREVAARVACADKPRPRASHACGSGQRRAPPPFCSRARPTFTVSLLRQRIKVGRAQRRPRALEQVLQQRRSRPCIWERDVDPLRLRRWRCPPALSRPAQSRPISGARLRCARHPGVPPAIRFGFPIKNKGAHHAPNDGIVLGQRRGKRHARPVPPATPRTVSLASPTPWLAVAFHRARMPHQLLRTVRGAHHEHAHVVVGLYAVPLQQKLCLEAPRRLILATGAFRQQRVDLVCARRRRPRPRAPGRHGARAVRTGPTEARVLGWGGAHKSCRKATGCAPHAPMKMMDGWIWADTANMARTSFSESPTHLDVRDEAEMAKKRACDSCATALASSVFPVPGGPNSRTPGSGGRPAGRRVRSRRCGVGPAPAPCVRACRRPHLWAAQAGR